ncbi:MAG: GNAT family N-acetyltransferase [Solirubrobacterales bacterium]|nr:GNAT family N-acetyltransferase [Solirubrobacterales bacterium]
MARVGEHAVCVHPEARGRGLGRALLAELCAESEHQGLYKLTRLCSPTTSQAGPHTAPPG